MEEYVAEVLFYGVPLWWRGIVGEDYINSYNKMAEIGNSGLLDELNKGFKRDFPMICKSGKYGDSKEYIDYMRKGYDGVMDKISKESRWLQFSVGDEFELIGHLKRFGKGVVNLRITKK